MSYYYYSLIDYDSFIQKLKNNEIWKIKIYNCNEEKEEIIEDLMKAIKFNTSLIELDLYRSNIGFNGIKALSDALKINSSLIKLNLSCNEIGI